MTACFLAGDSFPRDRHIEAELRRRLAGDFPEWLGQEEFLPEELNRLPTINIAARRAALEGRLGAGPHGRLVLIGRSSGGRVATQYAALHGATAVVCLGFPFRAPGRVMEPERFEPLARATVPTLLIQGREDPYGGSKITEDYRLSPAVTVRFFPTGHEFHLGADMWDEVAGTIRAFLAGLPSRPA